MRSMMFRFIPILRLMVTVHLPLARTCRQLVTSRPEMKMGDRIVMTLSALMHRASTWDDGIITPLLVLKPCPLSMLYTMRIPRAPCEIVTADWKLPGKPTACRVSCLAPATMRCRCPQFCISL